jgi:uncharacterized damage-inducible protein DinB
MQISDFKELFNYNHTVRQNYIDIFKQKLSWEVMVKNQETGWLSLKDTLLHIIWVEDSWINYSIQGLEDPNRPFPHSNYNSWKAIEDYNLNSTLKVNSYLDSLTPNDLWKSISRMNVDGIRGTTKFAITKFHCYLDLRSSNCISNALSWKHRI